MARKNLQQKDGVYSPKFSIRCNSASLRGGFLIRVTYSRKLRLPCAFLWTDTDPVTEHNNDAKWDGFRERRYYAGSVPCILC